MSNLINSIREYILTCPFLSDWRVNVDYLGTGMEYSIDPLPCDPVLQRYTDGFYQDFEEWLETQDMAGTLPELGENKIPIKVETLNSGYLYDVDEEKARYRIECRLIYRQEV